MLYHPDKHRDPELKRQAEQLFNLVHEAYEGEQHSGATHEAYVVILIEVFRDLNYIICGY